MIEFSWRKQEIANRNSGIMKSVFDKYNVLYFRLFVFDRVVTFIHNAFEKEFFIAQINLNYSD
jgi:hypothetical protein